MSNNPPFRSVDLTEEQYEFLVRNCDANIAYGLNAIQQDFSRETLEKLVGQMEAFKSIKETLEKSK